MNNTWGRTVLSVLLGALLLVGCGGGASSGSEDEADDEAKENVSDAETEETVPTKKPTYNDVTDPQGSVEGFVGAMKDADLEKCDPEGGRLIVEGTVTNPTDEMQHYRIYVSALQNGDARGIVQVDLAEVSAGATESWETFFELEDSDLECLMRVERFAPQT